MAWISALLLCAVAAAGCSTIRLPAIDPTGQRIFLPPPAYTTLESPGGLLSGCLPQPAFVQPPPVPPCESLVIAPACPPMVPLFAPGPAPATSPPAARIRQGPLPAARPGRLLLTPARIVAPVGSDVVLLAGVCGEDGYYLTRQPIEWLLSQDSVGHFVEVDSAHHLCSVLHGSPRKFSNNFARTRTSTTAETITRGTPSPSDDVQLGRGQTWITLTSPSAGTSYVTALATGEENWEQRRQSATIHWVDAQWSLPAPAVVPAGQSHVLSTTITRSSTAAPVPNWIVRYEVAEGAAAHFGQPGQTAIEVVTDASGVAGAQIMSETGQPGTTRVRIQIRTPAEDSGGSVAVGEGWATITWSAPGLTLRASGPETAAIDAAVTYRFEVASTGDLPATNVVLAARLPDSLAFESSNPGSERFGNRVRWQLGDLTAQQSRAVELNCRTLFEGDLRLEVEATADGLRSETSVATRVIAPSLEIRVVDPPTSASVGDRVHFNVEVANVGAFRVRSVTVRDTFDAGLENTQGLESPIERTLGDLEPGLASQFGIGFFVRRPGQLCHTIEAFAEGGHATSERICLDVAQPTLALAVEIRGPGQSQVGQQIEYEIRVTNTGEGPLSDVKIYDLTPPALVPRRASPNFRSTTSGLMWEIASLIPNEMQVRRVLCECVQEDPLAESQVTVTTAEGITRTAVARTTITAAAAPPRDGAAQPPPRGDEAAAGRLSISLAESANPINLGERTTYFIEITNDRDVSDKNVSVTFELPDGLEFQAFRSDSISLQVNPREGRVYEVDRIAEIRPNQIRRLQVDVTARRPGSQVFRVRVTSLRNSEPVVVEKETRVLDM